MAVPVSACSESASSRGRNTVPDADAALRDLQIVAHQDDDLLFQSPDLARAIRRGDVVRTVYLTAGDAGLPESYWADREHGARAAYARMAATAEDFATETRMVLGKKIVVCTSAKAPGVTLMFLRLPDGGLDGNGNALYGNQSLQQLWDGTLPSATTVDGTSQYTKQELIDVLSEIWNCPDFVDSGFV